MNSTVTDDLELKPYEWKILISSHRLISFCMDGKIGGFMAELRKKLIKKLENISDIDVHLWKPDSDFMVIDYKGKEVAHFHGSNEIDVRLSREIVKRDGLTNAPDRVGHLSRKNGGRWLVIRFTRESHLAEMIRMVKMAIELRECESK